MALTVVVRSGDLSTPPSISFDSPRIVIGRGDGCEVRLPDPSVSHRHASIRQRGSDYVIVDEGSTNGTFVGPVRLSPQAPRVVKNGELVRIGRIWLELRLEPVVPTQDAPLVTREIALRLVSSALAAQGERTNVVVRVVAGPDAGSELPLAELGRPYVLGRGPGLDLTLTDPDTSRRHVELLRRGDQLLVRDLGSKNGALLGEEPLPREGAVPWPRGKVLRVGSSELSYEDPVVTALAEIESGADEQLRERDDIDPPDGVPAPPVLPQRSEAPLAEVRLTKPTPAASSGFRAADVVIALLAVAVLVASLAGLYWLFRAR